MGYKKKSNSQYGIRPHRPNSLHSNRPFKIKTTETDTTTLFGKLPIVTREKKREKETTHVPDVVKEEGKTSLGFSVENQIGKLGISGAKENKMEMEFQEQHSNKSKRQKRPYV